MSKTVTESLDQSGDTNTSVDKTLQTMIELRGVTVHNLKNIDLDIPHGQRLTICGRSGSGKSSLAFNTLFAEGQRRYVENFSPYARQFLEQMSRPDAVRIDGIPPAVGIRGGGKRADERATVGTATETINFLRILFSHLAEPTCQKCNLVVKRNNAHSVAQWISTIPRDIRFQIGFERPVSESAEQTEGMRQLLADLNHAGFARVILDGKTIQLANAENLADPTKANSVIVIVDRLKTGNLESGRLLESLETAFKEGQGSIAVLVGIEPTGRETIDVDGKSWELNRFSSELQCSNCSATFTDPVPSLFSFNHPHGACQNCSATGTVTDDQGNETPCSACNGTRLNSDARSFRFADVGIHELSEFSIEQLLEWVRQRLDTSTLEFISELVMGLRQRLEFLVDVGLAYLTLARPAKSLSGGEFQRVALASTLGTSLVNMLYVLDEPSVGLHSQDVDRLETVIQELHRRGNTVVVVEHEPTLIARGDRVIEIGPDQGATSGHVVFDGTPEQLLANDDSLTGQYLAGRKAWYGGDHDLNRRPANRGSIKVRGARGRNLKNVQVELPLGLLCGVCGVSGAGKSTLIRDTVYPALLAQLGDERAKPLEVDSVGGFGNIGQVVLVDQALPAKTSRSNLVTYTKSFDDIRKLFAETHDASSKNLKPGHFSFNVEGGRCDKCKGEGHLRIDMQFMPEVLIKCDHCLGQRFKKETLDIKYRGQSISDVLNQTVHEAFLFFRGQPKIQSRLKFLKDVGLDYLTLGRTLSTLSTGERQRLKLAHFLTSTSRGRSLLILDEPTVGLHMADVTNLLDCFSALIAVGHSIIVIEHNLQLLQHADYLIDMGPGPGELGGTIVASGTPEEIMACSESVTGKWLTEFCR